MFLASERLWLTADGKRVVRDGDQEAHILLVAAGHTLPDAVAKRFGLIESAAKAVEAKAEAEIKAHRSPPKTKAKDGPTATK